MDPFTAALLLGVGGSVISGVWSAREAKKQREFQERMSNTAHEREVKDLRAAGLHPMMSSRGGGAATPSGAMAGVPDLGERASSAMAARMQRAQLELMESQTHDVAASAALKRQDMMHKALEVSAGKFELTAQAVLKGELEIEQLQKMFPLIEERARAEIGSMVSSARAADARALLDKYAAAGAFNVAEFERQIGVSGPWVKALSHALKTLRGRP